MVYTVGMTIAQRIVAIGAATGVISMILFIWGLMTVLPVPAITADPGSRLAYALTANVFALVPFFMMLVVIGNQRLFTDAIDPTRNAESLSMRVDGRVADNTLQQNFVFAVASLALSVVVPMNYLQVVWACALWFVVARTIFWIGYSAHPLYRAPGMAGTAYMNAGIILYVLYRVVAG